MPRPTRSRSTRGAGRRETLSPVELAIRHVSSRRRFEREVRAHLRRSRVAPSAIDEAVARLKELELLDDAETSRAWIRDRLRFSPRGRELLRADLQRQGVGAELAAAAVDDVYPRSAEPGVASDVLEKAAGKFVRLPAAVARRRMWSALARRGFDREVCREAIADFFEEHEVAENEEGA